MKNLLVLFLFAPSILFAQSRFDGTWEMKMETLQFSDSPGEYLLERGVYHCFTYAGEQGADWLARTLGIVANADDKKRL